MLESFASLLKLIRFRRLHIDGYVFRLHCILSVTIMMSFIVINSTKQLVGEPIACTKDKEIEDLNVINNWCYIRGIHSQNWTPLQHKQYSMSGIYTGLGYSERNNYRRNVYYQWVWFMLLFQAICFYFPRWLWKGFESGKIALFVTDLDLVSVKDETKAKKADIIVDYLCRTNGQNDWYAIKYFFCELLALVNVFFQMAINDIFLSGQYMTFGWDYIRYLSLDPNSNQDPMDTVFNLPFTEFSKVFPIQSKCTFNRFGISGGKVGLDFLCILTINIFNQKIYLFCWFWFIFLAIALSIVLVFRLILICCPLMRYYCCRLRFELSDKSRKQSRRLVTSRLGLGDWFILYMLGQNIEPILFCEIVENLCEKLPNEPNVYPVEEVSNTRTNFGDY